MMQSRKEMRLCPGSTMHDRSIMRADSRYAPHLRLDYVSGFAPHLCSHHGSHTQEVTFEPMVSAFALGGEQAVLAMLYTDDQLVGQSSGSHLLVLDAKTMLLLVGMWPDKYRDPTYADGWYFERGWQRKMYPPLDWPALPATDLVRVAEAWQRHYAGRHPDDWGKPFKDPRKS